MKQRSALALLMLTWVLGACGGTAPTTTAPTTTPTTTPSTLTTSEPPTTSIPSTTSTAPITTTIPTSTTEPQNLVSYVVQPGDTLWALAIRFDTTVETIAVQNGLPDPALIEIGQVLLIPVGDDPVLTAAVVMREGPRQYSRVALTFDAGSDAGHTEEILGILAQYQVRASFGLTGRWVEAYPELAERIVDQGHQVINHTYSHQSVTGFSTDSGPLNEAERRAQVEWGEAAITTATGVSPRPLFRPPYGDYDQLLLEQLPRWGYSHLVMWTVDSLGWNGLSPADISERCLAAAEPGAIYLFHVGSASADHAALSDILDGLLNRGLQPVTVAELLVG